MSFSHFPHSFTSVVPTAQCPPDIQHTLRMSRILSRDPRVRVTKVQETPESEGLRKESVETLLVHMDALETPRQNASRLQSTGRGVPGSME